MFHNVIDSILLVLGQAIKTKKKVSVNGYETPTLHRSIKLQYEST